MNLDGMIFFCTLAENDQSWEDQAWTSGMTPWLPRENMARCGFGRLDLL